MLIVYDSNKDNPYLSKRFMIAESKVAIDAGVVYPKYEPAEFFIKK